MRTKTALLIIISLLTSLLAGCARGDNPAPENAPNKEMGQPTAAVITEDGQWNGAGGCYKLRELGRSDGEVCAFTAGGDEYIAELFGDELPAIVLRLGGEVVRAENGFGTAVCAADSGGTWALVYRDFEEGDGWYLVKTDKDGRELLAKGFPEIQQSSWKLMLETDSSGNLYLLLGDALLIMDGEANIKRELSFSNKFLSYITRGGDGLVYVAVWENGVDTISSLNAETGELAPLLEGSMRLRDGGEGWRFLYMGADGLYGIPMDSLEAVPIALWWECGIVQSELRPVSPLPGGFYLLTDGSGLYLLEPAEPSEIPKKTVLTIAQVTAWGGLGDAISDFNLQSDKYYIRQADYSDGYKNYSPERIADAAVKFNTELIAGKYPDLIDFGNLNPQFYAQKGYLADLWEFIDADEELERGDFVFLDKLQTDGKLYYASKSFNIETALGLYSRFGDRYGWTFDEYLAIERECAGEVMYNMTAENFLSNIIPRYLPSAIDWASGTCDFENDSFIAILEAAKRVRENPEPTDHGDIDFTPGETRLRNGTLVVSLCWMSAVWDLAKAERDVGERVSFVGWPTPDGSCGSTLIPASPIGICSLGNTEGAWEFVKYLLTCEGVGGLSSYRPEFEKAIEEAIDPTEPVYVPDPEYTPDNPNLGNLVPVKAEPLMTREDADRLYALIDEIDCVTGYDYDIVNIINEEAAYYLAGDKTARETARIIQGRVSILVSERR